MGTTGQRGIFGFGAQSAMESAATAFYRHKATDIDIAPIDEVKMGNPEVGGGSFPTFPYKTGPVSAGGATIQPRLEDTLGWALYGALGAVNTITGDGVGDNPEVGVYRHEFKPGAVSNFLPWMSVRKYVPGAVGADDYGELYTDLKAVGLTMAFVNNGPLTARLDFLGRMFGFADPSGWAWENGFESFESIPIGCTVGGYMKIPGYSASELPIVGATVAIQNAPLDIQQEKVYGSPYLEDVTILQRVMTFDVMLKWQDADLYRSMLTGSTSGTSWAATPFVQDADILAVSPGDIAGQTQPYKLRAEAPSVMWQPNGGVRLAGNQSVMMRLSGIALEPSSGDYAKLSLDNKVAAYTWPS